MHAESIRALSLVMRGLLHFARCLWRAWTLICAILVALVLIIFGTAYLGYPHQSTTEQVPNKLTVKQTSDGIERMKLGFGASGQHQPFVGIAISGGGSRAANFGLAALRELEAIGLLEHAEPVSSVSGGSLAAAEIALHLDAKPTSAFWSSAFARAGKDLSAALVRDWLSPSTFFRTLVTPYDRGDILAKVFDTELYKGARFSAISTGGPNWYPTKYRPSVFFNATSISDPLLRGGGEQVDPRLPMGMYMSTFTYSFDRFREMNSDLAEMPIAYAVASSAAFPAAINPITLQLADVQRDSSGDKLFGKRYIHLADGGLSDNLGTDTLRKVYETRLRYQRTLNDDGREEFRERPCLIVSIDATAPPKFGPREASLRSDGRNTWWSSLVDATAVYGYDAYLLRRRADQLDEMGIDSAGIDYGKWTKSRPSAIIETSMRARYQRFQQAGMYRARPSIFTRTQSVEQPGIPLAFDFKEYRCTVWHIALEDLEVRRPETFSSPSERPISISNSARNGILRQLSDTSSSLETDFRLRSTVSPRCSVEELQSVLTRGAQELIHDAQTKPKVCAWMKSAKFDTTRCEAALMFPAVIPTTCIDKVVDREIDYLETALRESSKR